MLKVPPRENRTEESVSARCLICQDRISQTPATWCHLQKLIPTYAPRIQAASRLNLLNPKNCLQDPTRLSGATARPQQGPREGVGSESKTCITMTWPASNITPQDFALTDASGRSRSSLPQDGLVYGKEGMFPLEPGDVVICYKNGPAREIERFLFSFLFIFLSFFLV